MHLAPANFAGIHEAILARSFYYPLNRISQVHARKQRKGDGSETGEGEGGEKKQNESVLRPVSCKKHQNGGYTFLYIEPRSR